MTPAEFIAALTPGAQASAKATGVPASITIAQAALESGWGSSLLYRKAHNIFGIKADPSWTGSTIEMPTRECISGRWKIVTAHWRQYPDHSASILDHGKFLRANPRYKRCFQALGARAWAFALQSAGYATDPQYAAKLISIIGFHGLEKLDN